MEKTRLITAACVAVLATGSSTAYAETHIATTKKPTPIRSYAGVAAFSLYDEASATYRLAVSRLGGPPEIVTAVAAQAAAFDLDVGPDRANLPTIVYSRCTTLGLKPRGCDLYRYSLTTGREAKIAGASSPNGSETDPTIWRSRIAWARLRDTSGRDRKPRIYTRTLTSSRTRPSRRLPGLPRRLCGKDGCVVNELELRGRRLGVNGGYPGPVCNNGRIQLDSLTGRVVRVADTTCGLDGQQMLGVSFDASSLYFVRFCQAGACDARTGVFRYSLATARYSASPLRELPTGFSYDGGGRAYEVLAPLGPNGYCGNSVDDAVPQPDCIVVLTVPLTFTRTRPLR